MGERKNMVVVDASLALKWVVFEENTPQAQTLLSEWIARNCTILAPDLLLYEITNIFYKRMRRDELTLDKSIHAFHFLMNVSLNFVVLVDEKLSVKALNFARNYKLPATYDAHYLALAEREGCEFWTADERLYNSVKDQLSWVRLMADPAPAALPA